MSIANYKEHRQAFKALLEANCSKPILLFKGKSGNGKSTLMEHCQTQIHQDIHQVLVDLRSPTNVMQFFYKSAERLNWDSFEHFKKYLNELTQEFNINVNGNTQAGVGNMINVELKTFFESTTLEQRAERYTVLTHAWAKDINNLDHPCVLLLDAYEKAHTEFQDWVTRDLLNSAANSQHIRVVVAGQSVPDSFEWKHRSVIKELDGVHEAEEWLPVIKAMGRVVPSPSPIELLRGFCIALNGNPAAIKKLIEKFPRIQ
jgi:energy-coupling factor transporter ATP-binding protein EcfA2